MAQWQCTTCTYRNINPRSTRCAVCTADRENYDASNVNKKQPRQPAIIDLTELCTSKPSHRKGGTKKRKSRDHESNNSNDRSKSEDDASDIADIESGHHVPREKNIMESNRSRRRRLMGATENDSGGVKSSKKSKESNARRKSGSSSGSEGKNESKGSSSDFGLDSSSRLGSNGGSNDSSDFNRRKPQHEMDGSSNFSNRNTKAQETMSIDDDDDSDVIVDPSSLTHLPLNFRSDQNDVKSASISAESSDPSIPNVALLHNQTQHHDRQRKPSKLRKRREGDQFSTFNEEIREKSYTSTDDADVDSYSRHRENEHQYSKSGSDRNSIASERGAEAVSRKESYANQNSVYQAEQAIISTKNTTDRKAQESNSNNISRSQPEIVNVSRPAVKSNAAKQSAENSQPKESRLTDFYSKQTRPQIPIDTLMKKATSILQKTFKHQSLRSLQNEAVRGALQHKSQIIILATGGGKSLCYQLPALVNGGGIGNVGYGNDGSKIRAENSRVTIVVCPLIALMIDQVNNLLKKGVQTAACLSSSHTKKQKEEILHRLQLDKKDDLKRGKGKESIKTQTDLKLVPVQILYCTPELIQTDRFKAILNKLNSLNRLNMFAIDEAHCISSWGHDFRPAYKKLSWVREAFPDIPVMACESKHVTCRNVSKHFLRCTELFEFYQNIPHITGTGTATSKVIQDIREILCLDKTVPCLMGTFNRENISYEVRFKDSLNITGAQGAINDLMSVVKRQHDNAKRANQPCSGIVYVHKRDDCSFLANQITKTTGIIAAAYHSGLKDSEREETQQKWTLGEVNVAVATIAFGMGIDLPHVRYVIHWTMAKSLEGFYQESGRGGRDGKPSLSILYYSKDDASKFAFFVKQNAERAAQKSGRSGCNSQKMDHSLDELEGMVDYCTKPGCKRKYVLSHFGEKIDAELVCKKTCDFCKDPKKVERAIQASECMSAVVGSQRVMDARNNGFHDKGNKFFHNPLDSDEGEDEYDGFVGNDEGLLGGIDYGDGDEIIPDPGPTNGSAKGFVKASSILDKYETMECVKGSKGGSGFVNFKKRTFNEQQEAREEKKYSRVEIPDHLRQGMPDPLAGAYKKGNSESTVAPSSSLASEAERLKAEIEKLNRDKEAAMAKMGIVSSQKSSKTLHAPALSFKKRR